MCCLGTVPKVNEWIAVRVGPASNRSWTSRSLENKWPVVKYIELTPDRVARAEERLASVDVLGLQDRFDEFCEVLQERFGWQLGEPLHANTARRHADVPDSLRERIAADNALDVEFFEYACGSRTHAAALSAGAVSKPRPRGP